MDQGLKYRKNQIYLNISDNLFDLFKINAENDKVEYKIF